MGTSSCSTGRGSYVIVLNLHTRIFQMGETEAQRDKVTGPRSHSRSRGCPQDLWDQELALSSPGGHCELHGCSGWWAGLYHREDLSTCDTTDGLVLGLGAGVAMPHFPKARSLWGSFHLHANLIRNSKLPNGSEANLVKRRRGGPSELSAPLPTRSSGALEPSLEIWF